LPKLKNCAEAGPTIPTSSATATANTISGPVSVNTRKKDFVFGMRLGRNGSFGQTSYQPNQAASGQISRHHRASPCVHQEPLGNVVEHDPFQLGTGFPA
jgi:hypothetical protein